MHGFTQTDTEIRKNKLAMCPNITDLPLLRVFTISGDQLFELNYLGLFLSFLQQSITIIHSELLYGSQHSGSIDQHQGGCGGEYTGVRHLEVTPQPIQTQAYEHEKHQYQMQSQYQHHQDMYQYHRNQYQGQDQYHQSLSPI